MKVLYDPDRDGLRILFSDAPIESSKTEAGIILDFDSNGIVVGLELPEASQRMADPRQIIFAERTSGDARPGTAIAAIDEVQTAALFYG